jgi:amino acid transporter
MCPFICIRRFAFGWCLLLTVMLILGTKESAMFNLVVTIVHIVLVVFIIVVSVITVITVITAAVMFDLRHTSRRACCAGSYGVLPTLLGLAAVDCCMPAVHPAP